MWSLFDRDVPARRRETRIPSFQVLHVGLDVCLCARGLCVWAYCMLRCTVAMEKTRSTVWSEAQQLADNDDACIYTCMPGWVQYTYSWMQGQKSVGPSSLPFPFSRDKSPSFSRPPFKTCAAVNHCMQAGKLR